MDHVFESREAAAYEAWLDTPGGRAWTRAGHALMDSILDCHPGWRILDVGCGLGSTLEHLMERGMLAWGLDAGPVMAKMAARRLGERAEVRLGDAHDLPYEDNAFDAVVMVGTLELVERRAQVLAEAARVAMNRVCVVSLNSLSPFTWLGRWADTGHPLRPARPLALWSLNRLVREVLGPVPVRWGGATMWPNVRTGRWPWAGLVGVSAAVTPRFRPMPLVAHSAPGRATAQPAHSHGRVISLRRVR